MKRSDLTKYKQNAGMKIGKGSYGCVVLPAVSCNSKILPKNAVSKITYIEEGEEDEYENEIKILRHIKKIDPTQTYFISLIDECSLNISKLKTRTPKDIVEVEYLDDTLEDFHISSSEPDYIKRMTPSDISHNYCLVDDYLNHRNQIQLHGGYPLDEIKLQKKPKYYKSIQKHYKYIIKHLLEGLHQLHKHRIAHRDIKEFNMLCYIPPVITEYFKNKKLKTKNTTSKTVSHKNTKHNINNKHTKSIKKNKIISKPIIRYIDFGLSEFVSPTTDYGGLNNFVLSGSYGYIPMDILIMSNMEKYYKHYGGITSLETPSNKSAILKEVMDIYIHKYKSFYDDIYIEKIISVSSNSTTSRTYQSFFDVKLLSKIYDKILMTLKNKTFYKLYKQDISGWIYKSDIFALGITFAFIRNHYNLNYDKKLLDLINKMIKLSPDVRYDINQCLAHPFCK